MRITERVLLKATVLDLHGILAGAAATELLETTVRRLAVASSRPLVLNLEDVPSIDASGIGALVTAYGSVHRRGGTLRLAGVGRRVRTLLLVCRLVGVFELFDSVDDAVANGSGSGPGSSTNGSATFRMSDTSVDVIHQFLRLA
jgi:anti-anti-sigma factor